MTFKTCQACIASIVAKITPIPEQSRLHAEAAIHTEDPPEMKVSSLFAVADHAYARQIVYWVENSQERKSLAARER